MDDDYESLPESSPITYHMIAGATAGVCEHILVYPFDSIKTRLQCIRPVQRHQINGVFDGLYQIIFKEGWSKTTKGIGAVAVGAAPAHALYFSSYEYVKLTLSSPSFGILNNFAYGLSGAIGTALHDAIMTPADAVKQRLQLYQSPYRNSYQCFTRVLRYEGVPVLYRAYSTQLFMNIPYHSLYIICYENLQNITNPERRYLPWAHLLSSSISAAVAAFLTNPFDVCKTLLNTQDHCALSELPTKEKRQVRGAIEALKTVYRLEGSLGYFRGVTARILYTVPSASISWSVYELFKHYLLDTS